MKILPHLTRLILASTTASIAYAGPTKGLVMGICKAEVKSNIADVKRIKTSRFRQKTKSTQVTFRVTTGDGNVQKVICNVADGVTELTGDDGELIASKSRPAESRDS